MLLATILVIKVIWTTIFSGGPINLLFNLMDPLTTKASALCPVALILATREEVDTSTLRVVSVGVEMEELLFKEKLISYLTRL